MQEEVAPHFGGLPGAQEEILVCQGTSDAAGCSPSMPMLVSAELGYSVLRLAQPLDTDSEYRGRAEKKKHSPVSSGRASLNVSTASFCSSADTVVDADSDYRGRAVHFAQAEDRSAKTEASLARKQVEEDSWARKQAEEEALAKMMFKALQKKAEDSLIKRKAEEEAFLMRKAEEEALRLKKAGEEALARKKAELQALLKKHEFLQIWKHQILLRRFQNALSRLRAHVQDLPSIPSLCAEKEAMPRKKAELEAFMKKHEILQIWKHRILFRRFHSTVSNAINRIQEDRKIMRNPAFGYSGMPFHAPMPTMPRL
jgi:hypothetical protein